jgi:hypothetical protein
MDTPYMLRCLYSTAQNMLLLRINSHLPSQPTTGALDFSLREDPKSTQRQATKELRLCSQANAGQKTTSSLMHLVTAIGLDFTVKIFARCYCALTQTITPQLFIHYTSTTIFVFLISIGTNDELSSSIGYVSTSLLATVGSP